MVIKFTIMNFSFVPLTTKTPHFTANMDENMYPESMKTHFTKPYHRKLISGVGIEEICGSTRINLEKYDVYAMGKKKNEKKSFLWTKMRIIGREFQRSVLQGYLKIELISGYGYNSYIRTRGIEFGTKVVVILRLSDLIPLITEDGAVFKKRAVIDLGNDKYAPIDQVESFCILPLITSNELMNENVDDTRKIKDRANCRKRKAYAMKDKRGNRELIRSDAYKCMHKIVLRYKRQLPSDLYMDEFIKDVLENCTRIQNEFSTKKKKISFGYVDQEVKINESVDNTRNVPEVPEVSEVTEVPVVHMNNVDVRRLENMSMSRIKW